MTTATATKNVKSPKTLDATPVTPAPTGQSVADVLADLDRQAELARGRLVAVKRAAYERGLLAMARGSEMDDETLDAFYSAVQTLDISRAKLEADANKVKTWLLCVSQVETPEREAELRAALDVLDAEQRQLEARIPKLRLERFEAFRAVENVASTRHQATGSTLRNEFPTIDPEPVLVEIRAKNEAVGMPTTGLDAVIAMLRANRPSAN